jgi:iron(III) transport system permease protein
MLPLAVPGLVMAFGFIAVLRQLGLRWIIETSPIYILVIAYAVRRMPYLVRSAAGGLQQTSVTLEEAAANLGASPLKVLCKITLPLIMANLIAGSILTFSFSMLEVSDSLILAQYPQHFPITKMIYVLGNDTSGPTNVRDACALGVLAMGLLIATMTTAALLMGKKLGAVFRA